LWSLSHGKSSWWWERSKCKLHVEQYFIITSPLLKKYRHFCSVFWNMCASWCYQASFYLHCSMSFYTWFKHSLWMVFNFYLFFMVYH
jgi:hypothetical protein